MGTVTAIEPQKKRKGRVNLYIDGRFFAGLDELTLVRSGLKIGDEADEGELKEIITGSETASAFEKSVKLVSVRPRTAKDITEYLTRKGYPDEVAQAVIEKLAEYRYLDDAAYAELYIRSARARCGDRAMAFELKRRGVDEEIIRGLLDEREDDEREADARRVLDKYIRTHKKADRRTAWAHLMRRGFSSDIIRSAVSAAFSDRSEPDDDWDTDIE